MIAIIDYNAGNLTSVKRALDFLGQDSVVTSDYNKIIRADRVIFPGVGAAGKAMSDLKANRILNTMREKLMKALHQTGEKAEAKDSIDMGICIFDCTTHTLQYAGANRPLYRVRDGELTEFKADKMTIGVAPLIEESFKSQLVDYKPGDFYYLFSDGYADQFGEVSDKKFKIKNLKQTFSDISRLNMRDQKGALEKIFNDWKGNSRQIDDVLIFGFQF